MFNKFAASLIHQSKQMNMKSISFLLLLCLFAASCSKNDSKTDVPASANGLWVGSTNTYGVGALIRSNGTARQYWNTSSLTLGDTASGSLLKSEGTYSISGDSIFITGPTSSFKGKMNASFSSVQGSSSITAGGFIIKQTFTMSK